MELPTDFLSLGRGSVIGSVVTFVFFVATFFCYVATLAILNQDITTFFGFVMTFFFFSLSQHFFCSTASFSSSTCHGQNFFILTRIWVCEDSLESSLNEECSHGII